MKIFIRILILLVVVPATFYFFYWVPFSLFPFSEHRWIPGIISLLCAAAAGSYVWRKLGTAQHDLIQNVVLGAVALGGCGFSAGYYGPMIFTPGAEQAPLLGIFITGPAGLVIGALLGFLATKRQEKGGSNEANKVPGGMLKTWAWLFWSCGILSAFVIAVVLICVPWYDAKYSTVIETSSDLQKRDKALTTMHVRSLSDDDLIQLQKFTSLRYLDFYSGWGGEDALLTDKGLKNILALNLPKLETLMLGFCTKITDEGMQYVAQMKTLKYLSLAACPHITDAGLAKLAFSNSIETIDLRGNRGITDKGLGYLKNMSTLKLISLGGCNNISQTRIDELRKALPNTKIEKDDKDWAMCAT